MGSFAAYLFLFSLTCPIKSKHFDDRASCEQYVKQRGGVGCAQCTVSNPKERIQVNIEKIVGTA